MENHWSQWRHVNLPGGTPKWINKVLFLSVYKRPFGGLCRVSVCASVFTCSPLAFGTTLLSSMSHLLPSSILSTSSFACWKWRGVNREKGKRVRERGRKTDRERKQHLRLSGWWVEMVRFRPLWCQLILKLLLMSIYLRVASLYQLGLNQWLHKPVISLWERLTFSWE